MESVSINKISNINLILDIVHDQWFDLNDVRYINGEITIKFKREMKDEAEIIKNFFFWKKIKIPVKEYYLIINKVIDYNVVDTEKVGLYDFNTIEFSEKEKRINIITGIPIKLEIFVSNFNIEVKGTNNILDVKFKTRLF